jgi:hypothetical protein
LNFQQDEVFPVSPPDDLGNLPVRGHVDVLPTAGT